MKTSLSHSQDEVREVQCLERKQRLADRVPILRILIRCYEHDGIMKAYHTTRQSHSTIPQSTTQLSHLLQAALFGKSSSFSRIVRQALPSHRGEMYYTSG